ncbi:hypothetical protein SAMN05216456_1113 [Devosia crocina]|uniref:Uncharacterized protein n=1 Tax=Devosia crocina TaxID=429728 RepID=A0A1I7N852_9HYPH|nr:hypothetical protein [Devosia crocina]SFV30736.1 hypothetical protein SAMN05216456_1113 [Devosia crocina]
MSARIAPRAETMGIGFSPHLPRFARNNDRKPPTPDESQTQARPDAPDHAVPSAFEHDSILPAQTLFETSLLANRSSTGHFSPEDAFLRLRQDWSPPLSSFPLTDKTI